MKRVFSTIFALFVLISFANAASSIVHGIVQENNAQQITIKLPSNELLTALWTDSSQPWNSFSHASKSVIIQNMSVYIRLKYLPNGQAEVKELADVDSWNWLNFIRKKVQTGTITAITSTRLSVTFEDSRSFSYRLSKKTIITKKDKSHNVSDLRQGMVIKLTPRTLSNLDVLVTKVEILANN